MTFDLSTARSGRLEALLDAPRSGAPRARRSCSRTRTRVRRDDAHAGRAARGDRGLVRAGLRGAALQLPRRRRERGHGSTRARAKWRTSVAALDVMATRYPGAADLGGRASRSAPGSRWRPARRTRGCRRSSASAPPFERYDFSAVDGQREAEVPRPGRGRRALPAEGRAEALRAPGRAAANWSIVDGADHVFDGQAGEVGDALFELLEDFSAVRRARIAEPGAGPRSDSRSHRHHEGCRHRLRRPHAGGQGPQRHPAHHPSRRPRRARHRRGPAARARASTPRKWTT